MDDDTMKRLSRRFGPDVNAWPEPHRTEALVPAPADADAFGDDARLERLVLAAAALTTDEAATARAVRVRIAAGRSRSRRAWVRMASPQLVAAGFSGLLVLAALAGYTLPAPPVETDLTALAVGAVDPAPAFATARP